MLIPKTKENLINNTKKQIEEYEKQYSDGLITRGEKYNKVVDVWSKCTDTSKWDDERNFISWKIYENDRIETNSVYMMATQALEVLRLKWNN